MNDEARLIVASQACILLLHRKTGFYPALSSIIIYPDEYLARFREVDDNGVVTEWSDRLSGESWQLGSIVISWQDVQLRTAEPREAYNVVLHEFAHQLDAEDGLTAEMTSRRALSDRLRRGHLRMRRDTAHGRATVLDPYGEENLAEFFAVAVESFFERPAALLNWDKELYAELARYFRQNPDQWDKNGAD